MKSITLASGSKGNATLLFFDNGVNILIDIGISYRSFQTRLKECGIEDVKIDALVITHEHGDHVSGIGTLLAKKEMDVFMSKGTYYGLNRVNSDKIKGKNVTFIKSREAFDIKGIHVTPFAISHDAREPLGYCFEYENDKIVYLTDSGYVDISLFPIIENATLYIFEANHDPELLLLSDRTFELKQRILGDKGHLSNADSALILTKVIGEKTKHIVLAHMSEECNMIEICANTFLETFEHYNISTEPFEILFAKQDSPIEVKL